MECFPLIITQSRSMASICSQLVSASTLFFNTDGIASLLMQADCGSFIASPLMQAVCNRSSSSRSLGPRVGLGDEIINDDSLFTHLLDAAMGILEHTVPALHREYLEDISAIELGIRKYLGFSRMWHWSERAYPWWWFARVREMEIQILSVLKFQVKSLESQKRWDSWKSHERRVNRLNQTLVLNWLGMWVHIQSRL